jgi:predicted nucleotidyltransferase component of viral defense system
VDIQILKGNNKILCYSINEIIAEKLRSLMQRTAPRDLYDIWYLLECEGYEITDYISDFIEKANFKKINPNDLIPILEEKKEKFKRSWEFQLENQINDVPDFSEVWRTLKKHFKKFEKLI